MKCLFLVVFSVLSVSVFAQVVSVKSPDGINEIRIDTDPVLSYSVYRSGIQRIAPTPIAMQREGRGILGGANVKITSCDTVTLQGVVSTPIYKKSSIDEKANKTVVSFAGDWKVALIARNDGVAYRFETAFAGRSPIILFHLMRHTAEITETRCSAAGNRFILQ